MYLFKHCIITFKDVKFPYTWDLAISRTGIIDFLTCYKHSKGQTDTLF